MLLESRTKLDDAERMLRDVLRIKAQEPSGPEQRLGTDARRARKCVDRPRPCQEAEPLLREGLDIRRATLSADDWRVAYAQSTLGGCLVVLGRFAEAEPLLVPSYEQLAKNVHVARLSPARSVGTDRATLRPVG